MRDDGVRERIRSVVSDCGHELIGLTAVAGGDINRAWRAETDDAALFVKFNAAAPKGMFAAEARALEELAGPGLLRVPAVIHVDDDCLVLEYLELCGRDARVDARLGTALARLHRREHPSFGWHRDNFVGLTPQPNDRSEDWVAFFGEQRLMHQIRLLADAGGGDLRADGERLCAELPGFFSGYRPHPALLHGDLWAGNAAATPAAEPVIFDPASYHGDRETDLAMMELFGGFSPECLAAYRAEFPVDPGYTRRRPLYQLYHVLNHAVLFGGAYAHRAAGMMTRLLAET